MNFVCASKAITLKDFDRIRRTCMGDEKITPIMDTFIGDLKVIDLLKSTVTIEVANDDFFTKNMCEVCLNALFAVYKFKKQCQNTEAALKLLADNAFGTTTTLKEEGIS
ncbi:hypothetical protein Zmor_026782 [Zophobas morio]|uniref:ZAD domain-containing protein n=1 Tax=Zophobas morio TaxID=2755281 RepID=A0AA38M5T7_9CUCU|nr:hypothetical protein Zmor_026782 [Zophobas morio]